MASSRDLEFCTKLRCPDAADALDLRDPIFSRQWLREFRTDLWTLFELRSLVYNAGGSTNLFRLSDDEVLEQIAAWLNSGRIHVHPRGARTRQHPEWRFCRIRNCEEPASLTQLQDPAFAKLWLEDLQKQPRNMEALRKFLSEGNDLPDEELVRLAAQELATRTFHVHAPVRPEEEPGGASGKDAPVPFPLSQRRKYVPDIPKSKPAPVRAASVPIGPPPPPTPTPTPAPVPAPTPTPTPTPTPSPVTVVINMDQPVACPGLLFPLTAVGTPPGGQFLWTFGDGCIVVDDTGQPAFEGENVNLVSFQPDNGAGVIPSTTVTVNVTYTHPDGTVSASQDVPVHGIAFNVTGMGVHAGITKANELEDNLTIGDTGGVPSMSTSPNVGIQVESTCTRPGTCAACYQAGMLQTVVANQRDIRYTHTLISTKLDVPIRDQRGGPAPFYNGVFPFPGNGMAVTVSHEDNPYLEAAWTDPRIGAPDPPPPKNGKLRQVSFSNAFQVWLVAQNTEWAAHDAGSAFIFLRNFSWSVKLNVTVDVTQAKDHRCWPHSSQNQVSGVGIGKGGSSPALGAAFANNNFDRTMTAAPGI